MHEVGVCQGQHMPPYTVVRGSIYHHELLSTVLQPHSAPSSCLGETQVIAEAHTWGSPVPLTPSTAAPVA